MSCAPPMYDSHFSRTTLIWCPALGPKDCWQPSVEPGIVDPSLFKSLRDQERARDFVPGFFFYVFPETGCRPTRSIAQRIAASIPEASATPFPAIEKAVPWSGDVRTYGRPRVTLTELP